jgi:toxin-antitoxin system PIN domain toxin
MSSLSFPNLAVPDMNIWLALASSEHIHHRQALQWWQLYAGSIAFCRLSHLGILRLMTTAAAMDGKPLGILEAWRVYDRFYEDSRVIFLSEPPSVDETFRIKAEGHAASPKLWADAWLLAVAESADGVLVTFDRALAARGAHCLLAKRS